MRSSGTETRRRGLVRLFNLTWSIGLLGLLGLSSGCESAYPEIIVVNKTGRHILLKNVRFNGCVWEGVLAYGDATSPGRCLPGRDRIHFQKFDTQTYCLEGAEDGTLEGVCPCDPPKDPDDPDGVQVVQEPNWFNYQTLSVKSVSYGDVRVFEITLDDMEQDFTVPGPYGH